jgi:sec-independent protein translocase protein TatC
MPIDQPEEEATASEMSFLDHLEALRWHLIRSVLAVVLFGSLAFIFSDIVFDSVILAPKYDSFITYRFFCWLSQVIFSDASICMNNLNFELISTQMSGQFTTHLTVAFATGIVLAFPYLLWEIWRFVKPALYPREQKMANGMVFWGSFLFALGISFGYFVITPLSVYFFGNYQVSGLVANQIAVTSFISTVVTTTFGTGIVFELPILIYFLAKIGVVTPEFLKSARKISYIVILIVAAIITPPDVTSQIIVSIPLFLLYEAGIYIARRVQKNEETDGKMLK